VGDPYIILLYIGVYIYIICAYTQCVRVCQTNRRRFEEKKKNSISEKRKSNIIIYKCTHMHSCMCVHECEFMDPEHTIIIYLCRGEFKRTASSSSALLLLLLLLLYYYNKYNIYIVC
jgi:hypothetical protein